MRDPNRLINIYATLELYHRKYLPDMRMGQFMMNILGEIQNIAKRDPFFIEDSQFLEYFKQVMEGWGFGEKNRQ